VWCEQLREQYAYATPSAVGGLLWTAVELRKLTEANGE